MFSRMKPLSLAAIVAGVALVASYPSTSNAQDAAQTPENAWRFLATILPRSFSIGTDNGSISAQRITDLSPPRDNCTAEFQMRYPNGQELTGNLPWRLIADVRHQAESPYVSVTFRTSSMSYHFDFRSAVLAARAAYAMEFLRQHCDPTADTGF